MIYHQRHPCPDPDGTEVAFQGFHPDTHTQELYSSLPMIWPNETPAFGIVCG
jgi:hypothetical protein